MSLALIEINDTGLQVSIDDTFITSSPGFAVLHDNQLMTGSDAYANARLLPRWTNNRFWHQLGMDPLGNATPQLRHHADLAFAHLETLWTPIRDQADQVVFAVPPYYTREQLGLLLGMANECAMPVTGVIDSAVAAAASQQLSNTVLVLDIYLHCMVLTRLGASVQLTRTSTSTVSDIGILTLWDRWANIIANQFIQGTRYDPLHQAESEQALYNQLPAWITANPGPRAQFDLRMQDTTPSVAVTRDQLLAACSAVYPQIAQGVRANLASGEITRLYLTHRLRGFPGLRESMQLINNLEVHELEASAVRQSVITHADAITRNTTVSHIITLPVKATATAPERPTSSQPTHLLLDANAVPVGHAYRLAQNLASGLREDGTPACTVYTEGAAVHIDPHLPDIRVNGQVITGDTRLYTADVLEVDGKSITLISVS